MYVNDLRREQLEELKEWYLTELENEGTLEEIVGIKSVSYEVLANVNHYVSDQLVQHHFEGMVFTSDDFVCTAE